VVRAEVVEGTERRIEDWILADWDSPDVEAGPCRHPHRVEIWTRPPPGEDGKDAPAANALKAFVDEFHVNVTVDRERFRVPK
jgi:hypothetical protein